jgi:hypothetical protein
MGGDGGDGGAQARQQANEQSKQSARSLLNAQFGIGDPIEAIDRSKFITQGAPSVAGKWVGDDGGSVWTPATEAGPAVFDQAGYDREVAALTEKNAALGGNKAARDTLYQMVRDNSYNAGKRGLDEGRDDAARKTKFELFAKGLNGGSEDIEQNALLDRTYKQGIMDLGAKADGAKAEFRGNDEATRLGLLQSIDAGMDQGSALSSAIQQMQVNSDRAAADAQGTTLGDLFANTGLIYNKSQAAQGKQAGTEWWNNYNPSGNRNSKASGGMITGVQ